MSAMRIAFLCGTDSPDYGGRFARLRWKRALGSQEGTVLFPHAPADRAFASAQSWAVVRVEQAVPAFRRELPPAVPGHVWVVPGFPLSELPSIQTLRELESAALPSAPAENCKTVAALAFSTQDFPPARGETAEAFVARLLDPGTPRACFPGFAALLPEDPFGPRRPELVRFLPPQMRRLLAGGDRLQETLSALATRIPAPAVTHLGGDTAGELEHLASKGAGFDAILFADVLHHYEDPVGLLSRARSVAEAGATLVASIPNVGHLSLVRDLLLGRFDPAADGLADARQLRWFTRSFFSEVLEEAGWRVEALEAEAAPTVHGQEEFLARFSEWPGLDRRSLETLSWIAVARAVG